jgi:glyoxylase-like metal-dependent hydrolase (beta-lactamase superfamily II)
MTPSPQLLSAGNPGPYTGDGNNTWLLDGAEPTLIDAGTGEATHLEAIAGALHGRPLTRVLLTHDHSDHSSGVPRIRDCWPHVDVRAVASGTAAGRPLTDGEKVRAGDRVLQVIRTPGHAPDHVCFWDAASRELYSGDMVLQHTSVLIPAGRGGSVRAYLASLERMAGLGARRIYPGHGPVIEDPDTVIRRAVLHRLARESQIIACLDQGIADVDAIVARLYPGLQGGLERAARLTVEAHLEKIREDRGV